LKEEKDMLKEFEMELLRRQFNAYLKASKKEKSRIITQYCELTGVKRKTAVKRFSRFKRNYLFKEDSAFRSKRARGGRRRKYNSIHKEIVKRCWELSGCICAEKLHPMLTIYIEQLQRNRLLTFYEPRFIEEVRGISLGTLKRMIRDFPKVAKRREKGNAFIYQKVPIIADFSKYSFEGPGYMEVDFVEHNGGSSSGTFAITSIYTDIYSQWIARASGLGKNLHSMSEIDRIAHRKIPFEIIHYHPDNDKAILKVLFERVRGKDTTMLSRTRPYKKNDNAHVEQKGWDKVRKVVGYFRYEREEEVRILNEIWKRADLIDNFFIACFKLKEKIKDERGRTIKKIYERPKTPYQRLMESGYLEEEKKKELKKTYEGLDMVKLRKEIEELIDELIDLRGKGGKMKVNLGDKNYDLTSSVFQRHRILI